MGVSDGAFIGVLWVGLAFGFGFGRACTLLLWALLSRVGYHEREKSNDIMPLSLAG